MTEDIPFWRRKAMKDMTREEWESLCDGCGKCCLNKLQEEDDPKITYYTSVGCVLLDGATGRCCDYENRQAQVKDCVQLTSRNVRRLHWLPPTCGYRLVAEGKDLYWWHPLVSGDPETVHAAGISVKGRVAASEKDVPDDDLEKYIVEWPLRWPKGARRKPLVPGEESARRKPLAPGEENARRKPFAPGEGSARRKPPRRGG